MTHAQEDLHVYQRTIRHDERSSLLVLASLVPQRARVLDLGCGSGALGAYLAQHNAAVSDGVTLSEAEAQLARPHYRRVVVDNLETCNLPQLFSGERYDAIVCADVLEHLSSPERVLHACRDLLAPEGKLLISVPNVGYAGLVAELLQGEFRYRAEGLLDKTHLRFFTRASLQRFMAEQHWAVDLANDILRPIPDSEFNVAIDRLPPAVARYLLAAPDAGVYQFVGVATPAAYDAPPTSPPVAHHVSAQAWFTAQLYVERQGQFDEEKKITARGLMGHGRQTLVFPLLDVGGAATKLRLDPADRPGFVHLYSLILRAADGSALWSWSATSDAAAALQDARHSEIVWNFPLPSASDAALLLLSGDDPWVELPIHQSILDACGQAPGAQLEVDIAWPMSADYLALSTQVRALHTQLTHAESRIALSRIETVSVRDHARQLEATLTQLRPLQDTHERLQATHAALTEHVRRIETSTVIRVTRPLVRAKMQMDQLLGRGRSALPAQPAAPPHSLEAGGPQAAQPPMPAHRRPTARVDVIVPVFKGLRDTQTCIDSVLASQNATPFRLIAINDASPEPALTAWLREKAAQDTRMVLLENSENLGFVATVNRGMALDSEADVLLLNSDTEVAGNWLDRLRAAAGVAPDIGTVTPFSNNATICSYPHFCAANALPPGQDTASLDALFSDTHPGATLEIPTGVGFCMYIRRDCLTQTGMFDVARFGKGYGEENDFCQRARAQGWRHLQALDTFVRHAGGVSFGESKSLRELQAMETLRQLHPSYEGDVQAYVARDPARPFRAAIDLKRLNATGLPCVLQVVHSLGGGTLRHVQELASHFSAHASHLLLTPLADNIVKIEWLAAHETAHWFWHWPTQSDQVLDFLRHAGVAQVHFHHLLGVNPEMLEIPGRLGVPYDFTAHDYYLACPQIALVTTAQQYCEEQGIAQCNACLLQRPAPTGENILDWRLRHKLFLAGAANVLAPSLDASRRLVQYFPSARVRLAPHLDMPQGTPLTVHEPAPKAQGEWLRVLVLGALSQMKGADILEAAALAAAQTDAPLEFHLAGYAHRALKTQPSASLTVHGAYQDEDLPRLLNRLKPDIVWFPAQWPETYSYTLSACLTAGVPIVAPSLGSFPERLSGRPWTWLMPWNTPPAAWLRFFLGLRTDHFLAGQAPPPAPHFAAAPQDAQIEPWNYAQDYLAQIKVTQNLGTIVAS